MQKQIDHLAIFVVLVTFLILVLVAFIVTILYLYRRKQIAYQKNMEDLKINYENNLLNTQLEIQEQTFQNISREIHDNVSLSLTLAKLNLNTLDWNNLPKTENQINSSLVQISKAITDLSDISKSLNSDLIISQGLIRVMEKEIAKIKEMNLFELNYQITGNPVFMDSQKELVIFRIVQEAFNNIIKHAKATSVELELHYDDEHFNLSISDNGKGFCKKNLELIASKESKAGLNNMKKRAALFNGTTIIDSAPDSGTRILVTIPY